MLARLIAVFLLMLAAACSKGGPDAGSPKGLKLPATCDRNQFRDAIVQLDVLAVERDAALARIEALPVDEPAAYLRRLTAEQAQLRELGERARKVFAPRCLGHAKELFLRYLEESQGVVQMRQPNADLSAYRLARESAGRIHEQFTAEVKLQERNRH